MGEALAIVLSILLALRDEFEVNREILGQLIAFHTDLRDSSLALLKLAADPDREITAEEADQMIVDIAWWGSLVTFVSASLDALIQGAKLNLLSNMALRRMLTDWRSQLEVIKPV